jgi:hypothetical protein
VPRLVLVTIPSRNRRFRAEKRRLVQELEQERKRVKHLENELDVLKNDDQYMSLEDLGGSFTKMHGTRRDAVEQSNSHHPCLLSVPPWKTNTVWLLCQASTGKQQWIGYASIPTRNN